MVFTASNNPKPEALEAAAKHLLAQNDFYNSSHFRPFF